MRKKLLLLSAILITSLSASAQTVEVKEGWNLLGTACKIPVESLENSSVRTVWIWDKNENFWKVWSPIEAIVEVAKSYGIETFEEIPAYSGFWISANGSFTLSLCDKSYNVEKLVPFRGEIKHFDFEGGFYGIVDDTGKDYLPINLSDEFKVDGLKVEGVGELKPEVVTTVMWGTPVNILKIEKIGSSENSTIDLNKGLVAYWSFDNCDARDDSGNGNDGEYVMGNFTCVKGISGNALSFVGDSYIKGNIKTLPMGNSERTICLWARSGDGAESVEPNFAFSYGESIDRTAYGIFEDGPPWVESGNWFTYTHCGEEPCDIDSGIAVNGEWQFICSVYSNGTIKNYVNGVKGNEEIVSINTTGSNFYIATSPMEGYNFIGMIDEIRVYNRALSEEEIRALYESVLKGR